MMSSSFFWPFAQPDYWRKFANDRRTDSFLPRATRPCFADLAPQLGRRLFQRVCNAQRRVNQSR